MNSIDNDRLKKIIEICNSKAKDWQKVDDLNSLSSFIINNKLRDNVKSIFELNPNVFRDKDIIFMVKELAESVLLAQPVRKSYLINFKFAMFKKVISIRF